MTEDDKDKCTPPWHGDNTDAARATNKDDALLSIEHAKRVLESAFYAPSREKALALTKLDEAALWIGAIKELPR